MRLTVAILLTCWGLLGVWFNHKDQNKWTRNAWIGAIPIYWLFYFLPLS